MITFKTNKFKTNPYTGDCWSTPQVLVRGKIRLEHPKFEGHVTPNEDKNQISVQLKFRYCILEYHNSLLIF